MDIDRKYCKKKAPAVPVVYSRLSATRIDNDIESRLACTLSNDDILEHNFNTPAHILRDFFFRPNISRLGIA